MTLQEIAKRIDAHLTRFESDPKTNPVDPTYQTKPFYCARAHVLPRARTVFVVYVAYQGARKLDREQAERYLAWLDAGNVGTHWQIPDGWTPPVPAEGAQP